jgi:ABC-2 type transport system ATP-binding protein
MMEAHELTKRYDDKTAVDGFSFTIAPGSFTGSSGRTAPASPPPGG